MKGQYCIRKKQLPAYLRPMSRTDVICALSTAPGMGAIALIRMSGAGSISILENHLNKPGPYTSRRAYFGAFLRNGSLIDEVVATVFLSPNSYTGEDVVEIACHGSVYIQEQIIHALIDSGARLADPGEYTLRAFMNGKMDLSQAEAVADLIATENAAGHQVALQQMRGGFSNDLKVLREELIHFASLIELELDFAEEDVEFANRSDLLKLIAQISMKIRSLVDSFQVGNVIKKGVPVAIIGAPNAGKSTLLNKLLNEERAIVSEIAGTTRDTIEDEISIDGIKFRFIDTAGIRHTTDEIESIGIRKAYEKVEQAAIVLFLFDASEPVEEFERQWNELKPAFGGRKVIVLWSKSDKSLEKSSAPEGVKALPVSALRGIGIEDLKRELIAEINLNPLHNRETIVSNVRHVRALSLALEALVRADEGLRNGVTGDFLAQDIRQALFHLGEITGEISTDDLLDNIFSKFCIGK
jgi:tRNA modification GTPase